MEKKIDKEGQDPEDLLKYLKVAQMSESHNSLEIFDAITLSLNNEEFWETFTAILQNLSTENKLDDLVTYKECSIAKSLQEILTKKGSKCETTHLDGIIEAISIIADTATGKEKCFSYLEEIINLFIVCQLEFSTRFEAYKLINSLLQDVRKTQITQLTSKKNIKLFLEKNGDYLRQAGDYDFQATILEALLRLLHNKDKEFYANAWFNSSDSVKRAFLAIQNNAFEHLKPPCHKDVPTFWVDFNIGSKSLSAFVNDDGDQSPDAAWENIVIKADNTSDVRLIDKGNSWLLFLKLNIETSELVPFCPEATEKYAKIRINKELFGNCKYIFDKSNFDISSPSQSSPLPSGMVSNPILIRTKGNLVVEAKTAEEIKKRSKHPEQSTANVIEEKGKELRDKREPLSTIEIDGIVPETQEDNTSAEETTNVKFVLPESLVQPQNSMPENIAQKSPPKPGKVEYKKKLRTISKPKPKPNVNSFSPFAFNEILSDNDKGKKVAKPATKTNKNKAQRKTRNPKPGIYTFPSESTSTGPSDEQGAQKKKRMRKLFKAWKKSSGEEYDPRKGEVKDPFNVSDDELTIRASTKTPSRSFTDPRKAKKKQVKRTFEKKRIALTQKYEKAEKSLLKSTNSTSLYGGVLENFSLLGDNDDDELMPQQEEPPATGGSNEQLKHAAAKSIKNVTSTSDSLTLYSDDDYIQECASSLESVRGEQPKEEFLVKEVDSSRNKKSEGKSKASNFHDKKEKGDFKEKRGLPQKRSVSFSSEDGSKPTESDVEDTTGHSEIPDFDEDNDAIEYTPANTDFKKYHRKVNDENTTYSDDSYDKWQAESQEVYSPKAKKSLMKFVGEKTPDSNDKKISEDSNEIIIDSSSEIDEDVPTVDDNYESNTKPNPVESFSIISRKIIEMSRQADANSALVDQQTVEVSRFSSTSTTEKRPHSSTRNLLPCDSGIMLDVSTPGSKIPSYSTTSPMPYHSNEDDDVESSREQDIFQSGGGGTTSSNGQDADSDENHNDDEGDDRCFSDDEVMAHLKTPEVVKAFRKKIEKEKTPKQKQVRRKAVMKKKVSGQSLKQSEHESQLSSTSSSPIPRKRTRVSNIHYNTSGSFGSTLCDDQEPLYKGDSLVSEHTTEEIEGNGLQSILTSFSDKLEKTVDRKETLMQRFTDSAGEILRKKLSSMWKYQRDERQGFLNETKLNIQIELDSLKNAMDNDHEREEKLMRMLLEHQKERKKSIITQKNGLENIQKINTSLFSGLESIEARQSKQKFKVDLSLRKEMKKIQAALLRESRKQEMKSVQRNLKGILSSL
eukprot:gene4782-5409_t